MAISDSLKNISAMAGGGLRYATNAPAQYGDRQKQYYAAETAAFTEKIAPYSSDYFLAAVQGLVREDFYEWTDEYIRLADIVKQSTAITKQSDDFKSVLFASKHIDYVPRGAKIAAAGSVWLVTNPRNISGPVATAVVERCNAVWCHFDYYGNILKEPLVIASGAARASSNNSQEFVLLTEGYYTAKAQLNSQTSDLGQNSRLILGAKAYAVTGFTDFIQEFTGDDESSHMCEFTLRYEEPNEEIDDLENKVAGGKTFSWDISVEGERDIPAGSTVNFRAVSVRNGQTVIGTEQRPISYIWSSGDENIATVDAQGNVTAVSEGECDIICRLEQNPSKYAVKAVNVTAGEMGGQVRFTGYVPETLEAYQSAEISAAYFENGAITEEAVEWTFDGAAEGTYTAVRSGNTITVTCYGYSPSPLIISAAFGQYGAEKKITLLGV